MACFQILCKNHILRQSKSGKCPKLMSFPSTLQFSLRQCGPHGYPVSVQMQKRRQCNSPAARSNDTYICHTTLILSSSPRILFSVPVEKPAYIAVMTPDPHSSDQNSHNVKTLSNEPSQSRNLPDSQKITMPIIKRIITRIESQRYISCKIYR